ncbi:uncharacterized protein LOC129950461 [Eupeodes corollae]|uniref:uncharacterized protein LOC129950461 n=1 Tax=Eupeodes corollae TaxID=290404 RepID=UPI0024902469|nr:uncharacterized protein LOC129950461 [Eupeodes corollae]
MTTNPNESFQIHNYSFAAIYAFIQKVKEYPMLYKDHTKNVDTHWSEIVRSLLENGADCILTHSQKLYWERIYRGLWMWMRHIFTRDMVARYLGQVGLSQNPKYVWLEFLSFLEPFVHLSANSFNCDTDLDPFIYLQVLSSEETTLVPYSQYMQYWKQFEETLDADTYYVSICVQTMDYLPYDDLKLELELFLEKISEIKDIAMDNKDDDDDDYDNNYDILQDKVIEFSPVSSTTSSDIIEEQLITSLIEDTEDYDDFLSFFITNIEKSDE